MLAPEIGSERKDEWKTNREGRKEEGIKGRLDG